MIPNLSLSCTSQSIGSIHQDNRQQYFNGVISCMPDSGAATLSVPRVSILSGLNSVLTESVPASRVNFYHTSDIEGKRYKCEELPPSYVVAQTPQKGSAVMPVSRELENLITYTFDLRKGLFQCFTPHASSDDHSIANTLMQGLESHRQCSERFVFSGRYELMSVAQSVPNNTQQRLLDGTLQTLPAQDIKHYVIEVKNESDGSSFQVPLTEYSPPLSNGVLQAQHIERAAILHAQHESADHFTAHKQIPVDLGQGFVLQVPINRRDHTPVVGHVSVGSSAVIVSYQELAGRITEGQITEQSQIDEQLKQIVEQGRKNCGAEFVGSDAQLEQIKQAVTSLLFRKRFNQEGTHDLPYAVAKTLEPDTLKAFRLASQNFRNAADYHTKTLRINSDSDLELFGQRRHLYANLTAIKLGPNVTDAGLAHLSNIKTLTSLDLSGCGNVTDAGLEHLKGLNKLTYLNLSGCDKITDAGLAHLKRLDTLAALNLSQCDRITDKGLACLKDLPLNKLHLSWSSGITGLGVAHLNDLSLTYFSLLCSDGTDEDLELIAGLAKLTHLSLCEGIFFSIDGVSHLKNERLTHLYIGRSGNITDEVLEHISNLSLTNLILDECYEITDSGLAHLSKILTLTHLTLSSCSLITNNGLAHLQKLPLTHLDLVALGKISGQGFAYLKDLPLTKLNLECCFHFHDADLAHLSNLPLTFLQLYENYEITEQGLAHLVKLSKLTHLNIEYCFDTTANGANLSLLKTPIDRFKREGPPFPTYYEEDWVP